MGLRKTSRAFSSSHAQGREFRREAGSEERNDALGEPKANRETKSRFSEERMAAISADERKFCEMGWDALREALQVFADKGDVQMCAMMSLIAAEELQVETRTVIRFLESYVDLLHRLRFFTYASYLRKHTSVRSVRVPTELETIIYTSCGRCRKPMAIPAARGSEGLRKGRYSYCQKCKAQTVNCAICHLPVRALLFQCSVCNHGGHQDCYYQYYTRRPRVELGFLAGIPMGGELDLTLLGIERKDSSSSMGGSDESVPTESGSGSDGQYAKPPSRVLTHPCAAGCGHFCWAATGYHDAL